MRPHAKGTAQRRRPDRPDLRACPPMRAALHAIGISVLLFIQVRYLWHQMRGSERLARPQLRDALIV